MSFDFERPKNANIMIDENNIVVFLGEFKDNYDSLTFSAEDSERIREHQVNYSLETREKLLARLNGLFAAGRSNVTDQEQLRFYGLVLALNEKVSKENPLAEGGDFHFG